MIYLPSKIQFPKDIPMTQSILEETYSMEFSAQNNKTSAAWYIDRNLADQYSMTFNVLRVTFYVF